MGGGVGVVQRLGLGVIWRWRGVRVWKKKGEGEMQYPCTMLSFTNTVSVKEDSALSEKKNL